MSKRERLGRHAPRRPQSEAEIGFERRPMVRWLQPDLLVKAGLEVAISDLFARFVDKREVEAGLPSEPHEPRRKFFGRRRARVGPYTDDSYRDEDGALWFDYASDVGEGFDPTYTVAWMLAKSRLPVTTSGGPANLPRGRFLVLGGDQAYPAASWPEYQNRFVGPYRAALPFAPEDEAPHLYAIPGNHDWYDGLTAFMRLFCQGGWIGGWRTRQKRSYFAWRLSERWWLWATDIQFDTYIDGPQLDYFRQVAEDPDFGDDSRVILMTAKPSWVNAEPEEHPTVKKIGSWEALRYFEENLVESTGAQVAVTVSGDKHHYSRYQREGPGMPQERITAGGGGAHTSATHGLPAERDLRPDGTETPLRYELKSCSPEMDESRRMRRRGVVQLAQEWQLGAVIGVIYAALAFLLVLAIKDQNKNLKDTLDNSPSYIELAGDATNSIAAWSLSAALGIALFLFAATSHSKEGALRNLGAKPKRWLFAFAHTLPHVVVIWASTIGLLMVAYDVWHGLADDGSWISAPVTLGVFVVGLFAGRLILGLYLFLANLDDPRQHATEIFGGLASSEWKNFLRFKLDADERLTIYPIGIPKSPHWQLMPRGSNTESWFATPDGRDPEYALIEDEIVIDPDASK